MASELHSPCAGSRGRGPAEEGDKAVMQATGTEEATLPEAWGVNLEDWSGPIDKLLELIETRKLGIDRVSLARVTSDFLAYLETLTVHERSRGKEDRGLFGSHHAHLRLLADFAVVASRLLYLKSKSLLPGAEASEEEERELRDLTERLRWYQEFKPAIRTLTALWRGDAREYARSYFAYGTHTAYAFYPGERLTAERLCASLEAVFRDVELVRKEEEVLRRRVVSLEEKIKEIIRWFEREKEMSFGGLATKTSRSEVIVAFLAILHLAREQVVFLEQERHLSDIIVKKKQ